METVWIILLFILGLILTIKGGDWFVDAAAWLAEATGIPKFLIGATVVSFATTLPELLVSSIATWQGQMDMAMGNAVGSVNCNTGIILALSVLFLGGPVARKQFQNKGLLFILACVVLFFFSNDLQISLIEVVVLMLISILFIADSIKEGIETFGNEKTERPKIEKKEKFKNIMLFIVGAASMAIGAKLLVDNGEKLAVLMHVPDIIISITLVALGTSLPELVTTITAIKKKQSDISIGNIVGANVLDMCFVVPISGIIAAAKSGAFLTIDLSYKTIHTPMSILVALIAVVPTLIFKKTSKWQGALLLAVYAAYIAVSVVLI